MSVFFLTFFTPLSIHKAPVTVVTERRTAWACSLVSLTRFTVIPTHELIFHLRLFNRIPSSVSLIRSADFFLFYPSLSYLLSSPKGSPPQKGCAGGRLKTYSLRSPPLPPGSGLSLLIVSRTIWKSRPSCLCYMWSRLANLFEIRVVENNLFSTNFYLKC